jgi:anti-sigma B factor antagonist
VEIRVREAGLVTVLDLSGKLTVYQGVEPLLETVDRFLHGGSSKILINLDDVPYIDSAGIGALVTCYKRSTDRSAILKLLNPKKRVFDLLHVTKLDSIFECFHEEQAAIASFAIGQGPSRPGE